MVLGFLTFFSALTISAVAIYYSVAGLVAIFAAAAIPIIVMGVSLEVGKLVTAVWLHRNWERAAWWLKTYLSIAVLVLMFITSMGIFGFLSKAHIEQTSAGTESIAQVERIENEIKRNEDIIVRAENQIKKLESSGTGSDANIQSQIDKEQERIDNAYKRIQPAIDEQQAIIDSQASLWRSELAKIDAEVETLQGYIDNGETKKAQQMIGASADGIFGKKTADKIGDWQDEKQKERLALIKKIEEATNNPQAKAAAEEIKRLRKTAEDQVKQSNALIDRLRKQLGNTDKADSIDAEIDTQTLRIKNANTEIDTLVEQKYKIEGEYRKLEAEVGPIKYIAEFIYGEQADQTLLEAAVRWVIIIIIFVFDPLAVLLLIASQYTFNWYREDKGGSLPPKSDPEGPNKDNDDDRDLQDPSYDADADDGTVVPEDDTSNTTEHDQRMEQVEVQDDDNKEVSNFNKYEKVRAEMIQANIPPEFENEDDRTEDSKDTEERTETSSKAQDEESVPGQDKTDPTVAETEETNLDKWNEWVDAANAEAEKETEESDIPDTKNRIFYAEELTPEFQKKRADATSYITKVENKQIRKKTQPEEQDPTSQQ